MCASDKKSDCNRFWVEILGRKMESVERVALALADIKWEVKLAYLSIN